MNTKNSLPGTCFQCGCAVPAGKGQLLKNSGRWRRPLVEGPHRFVLRCASCSATKAPNPEKPAKAPPLPSSTPVPRLPSPGSPAFDSYKHGLLAPPKVTYRKLY